MNLKLLATATILAATNLIAPVKAQETAPSTPTNQTPAAQDNQVLNACVENRAETLPVPFSDVPRDHWAFKAVMTMHYCGAFRQATPRNAFDQLKPTPSQAQPQTERQS